MRHIPTVIASAVLFAACGTGSMVGNSPSSATPYDGPMSLSLDYSDDATVAARSGGAGQALECDGDLYAGGGGNYDGGLESVQDNATAALENLFEKEGFAATLPAEDYRIERTDGGRVLFSYDVMDQTKVAFIVSDDVSDFNHETGWGVESWAQCDPAEFPQSVTEALDIGVWQDDSGARLPVAQIQSYHGAEHCGWEDITFLRLGAPGEGTVYVRDVFGDFKDFLKTSYDASASLPPDATDTGWRLAGRQLWLTPEDDAAYLTKLDDATDVEQWPAEARPIGCA